jgi:LysM repeat protein
MSTDDANNLSDEFKTEIKKSRKNKNFLGTILATLAIILIFGSIGVALYQLLQSPGASDNTPAAQKIVSKPAADNTKTTQTTTKTPTPIASTSNASSNSSNSNATSTSQNYTSYTVAAGDTWSSIANANGMTSSDLMKYNNTTSEDLQIGQTIKIPKS